MCCTYIYGFVEKPSKEFVRNTSNTKMHLTSSDTQHSKTNALLRTSMDVVCTSMECCLKYVKKAQMQPNMSIKNAVKPVLCYIHLWNVEHIHGICQKYVETHRCTLERVCQHT